MARGRRLRKIKSQNVCVIRSITTTKKKEGETEGETEWKGRDVSRD